MSPTGTDNAHRASAAVHGDELMQQLRKGWRPLPNKTLLALAMGGLRVRMMRSVVTMFSVVLAIAFLTYTGLTNYVTFNLAAAAQQSAGFTAVDARRVGEAVDSVAGLDLFTAMPLKDQCDLAVYLGLDQTEGAEAERITLPQRLIKAQFEQGEAQKQLDALLADPRAIKGDVDDARRKAAAAEKQVVKLKGRGDELVSLLEFARWVRDGGAGGDEKLRARLVDALSLRYRTLVGQLRNLAQIADADLDPLERLLALARPRAAAALGPLDAAIRQERDKRAAVELRKLLQNAGVNIDKTLAGNPMDTWLIVMAMLTCAVGIANAMLMSVTERFREIGTMKCLGAQDNLVVKLFLLESGFLGVIGAIIGIVLGIVVALLAAVLQFNGYGLKSFPLAQSVNVIVLSVLGGVLLAVAGAVYPAIMAARMRPVDALRVDE